MAVKQADMVIDYTIEYISTANSKISVKVHSKYLNTIPVG